MSLWASPALRADQCISSIRQQARQSAKTANDRASPYATFYLRIVPLLGAEPRHPTPRSTTRSTSARSELTLAEYNVRAACTIIELGVLMLDLLDVQSPAVLEALLRKTSVGTSLVRRTDRKCARL
jgi:hypothetical protein